MTAAENSTENLGDALLEAGWLLVAILVPLVVNLWGGQPFDLPKVAILRSLVWLMLGVWLADGLLRRRPLWRELAGNWLLWPAMGLAAAYALATILAVDRWLSLWGSYERAQGALTLFSYVLLFVLVSARLRTFAQARRLVGVMAATAAPIVALGLAQALGRDPLGLITDARSPIYATLGRSNFVGAYLAMLLPLTLVLTLAGGQKRWRLAGGALLAGEVVVLALSLARGAWLAAAVGLAVLGLAWFWPRLARPWRRAALAGGLAGLAAALAGLLWLGRQGGSAAARLTIWRASLELAVQRPLLGYGPDALGLVFPRVYPPELVYYQGRGVTVDRAHNLFLDWLLAGGAVGLLAGLVLLAVLAAGGWRAMQRASDPWRRALLAACLAAVLGNVAGNLVGFDVPATITATWLLMAVIVSLDRLEQPAAAAAAGPPAQGGWGRLRPVAAGLAAVVLISIVGSVVVANGRPLAADVAAQAAAARGARGDWAGAIRAGEQAVALWPGEPAHRLALSWAYLQRATGSIGDPLPWLQTAEAELLAARARRPGDPEIWAALGELYGAWGMRWDAAKLALAHEAYRQATALAPNQATLYTAWGTLDKEAGRPGEAADKFRRAVDLDATDGYAWTHLGDVELAQGRVADALAAYEQAAHWAPDLIYAHLGLARCYWQLDRRLEAKDALAQVLALDPGNPAALALEREMGQGP